MTYRLSTIALPLFCAAAVIYAAPAAASPAQDDTEIRTLMDTYHAAVVGHDGAKLASLFVPEGSAWFSVLSDLQYAKVRANNTSALKVRPSTVPTFADFVTRSKDSLDPQHEKVRIDSDGAIASVYFQFRFVINGKVQNRGSESWQLVKGAEGWRIASIVYSSTPAA
ncbi:MAG: hypothetical protein ACRYFW_04275 [Janthinobacterium lividum]